MTDRFPKELVEKVEREFEPFVGDPLERRMMAIAAIEAAIPPGWRLAPTEPAADMNALGARAIRDTMNDTPNFAERARLCYAAMLAAAPSPWEK